MSEFVAIGINFCVSANKQHFFSKSSCIVVLCKQVWGCGGTAARESQQRQKDWEKRVVTKEQNRKVFVHDCSSQTE